MIKSEKGQRTDDPGRRLPVLRAVPVPLAYLSIHLAAAPDATGRMHLAADQREDVSGAGMSAQANRAGIMSARVDIGGR